MSLEVCNASNEDSKSHCLCPVLPPSLDVSRFAHHMLKQRDLVTGLKAKESTYVN